MNIRTANLISDASRIDFDPAMQNILLVNPRLSKQEIDSLSTLKNEFDEKISRFGYFLIASSGSSQKANESIKLFALSRAAVLNSAARFNGYFKAEPRDAWFMVLPSFHIAGLSILARAYLAKAHVTFGDWQGPRAMAESLVESSAAFVSLVPTQVFDIVSENIEAPKSLKKVFVGAGALNPDVRLRFGKLGWPMIETYGMTETCSMVAVREGERSYVALPGVSIRVAEGVEGKVSFRCDSLAEYSLQVQGGKVISKSLLNEGWLEADDHVRILRSSDSIVQFEILGRGRDYIKILGEGVSLSELRFKLEQILGLKSCDLTSWHLTSVEDDRQQNKIVLVVDRSIENKMIIDIITQFNLIVRPYEKINFWTHWNSIESGVNLLPRTALGKIKEAEVQDFLKLRLFASNKKQM